MSEEITVTKTINNIKKTIQKQFIYINNPEEDILKAGGSLIVKISYDPKTIFHFLKFLFNKKYVDLDKEKGLFFVDDKTNWEFLLRTRRGYLRVYDWKGYSVSIGSVSADVSDDLKKDAISLKNIIESNITNFLEFKKIESKKTLQENPLYNFMHAFASLDMLFKFSLERNKKDNFGLIESLILLVSFIDTMLRYSILLTRINKRKSTEIDPDLLELFFQKGNEYMSERDIFRIAQKEVDFIKHDKPLFFKRANDLYDLRNRVVHRYAITNFQYIEIKDIISQYKDLRKVLSDLVSRLEREQADLKVGFITKEDLKPLSYTELTKRLDDVFETKVNPYKIIKTAPQREAIFSDKFENGVNPKFEYIFEKIMKNNNK